MEILIIILRTIFYYILFLILFRIMGKREVGEIGINDLIVSVLLAQFASIAIENYDDSFIKTFIPSLLIVLLQVIISFISLKNIKFRELIDSKPSLIIKNGIINFKEMEKQRYGIEDLLTQVRDKGIKSLDQIEYAILENNGKLSIFMYDNKNIYPMPLIIDGIIQFDTLKELNKNKVWVNSILKKEKVKLEDVFYAFYKNNKCFIIKKD